MTAKRLLQLVACAFATACAKQAAPAATGCGGDAGCGSQQICDQAGHPPACKDVTVASVEITSPAANSFAGLQLQTTATARAPGGVNGVDFQVRSASGTLLAHAAGVATPAGSSNFAATVTLNNAAIVDGNANLVAVESYPAGTKESAPLPIKVDLTAPAFSAGSTTPAWLGPATPTASIKVTVTDSASGVDASSVKLTLVEVSHDPYAAVVDTNNAYTFTVPMADLGIAAGNSGTVHFKLDAKDKVGNAAPTLSGQGFEAIQVDVVAPTAAFTSDAAYTAWHAASESVPVTGTASDADSGLVGGAAKVVLTGGDATLGRLDQPGSLSSSGFSVTANLGSLTFPTSQEGAFPIHVAVTDEVGNTRTIDGSLNVDNEAPRVSFTGSGVTEAADFHGTHDYYKVSGADLTVTARLVDQAGVRPGTVCLRLSGETGNCLHPGTRTAGTDADGTWTFALPRSAGATNDGATPVSYTIEADDMLAQAASGAEKAAHQARITAPQIYFDDVAPVVSLTADATWYSKAGGSLTITAGVTEVGSGIKSAVLTEVSSTANGAPIPAKNCTLTNCTFMLPLTDFILQEAALRYSVVVTDNLDNVSTTQTDQRNVDGTPPVVSIKSVVHQSLPTAQSTTVSYPTVSGTVNGPILNTGYDASHFVYSDTIVITGTIQDSGAGIAVNGSSTPPSPNFEVDGTGTGPKFAIGSCTDGQTTTCNFTATVTLNDPTQAGAFAASDSTMQVIVNSADKAVDASGKPAGNVGSSTAVSFTVTRFWWKQGLTGSSTVSGLAMYPANGTAGVGDVIATTPAAAGFASVFSLYRNGPLHSGGAVAWSKGASFYALNTDLGSVEAAPAIGASATTPNIYIATKGGDVVAFNGSGGTVWSCAANGGTTALIDPVHQTPAIVQASKVRTQSSCEAVIAGADNSNIWAVCGTGPSACNSSSATIAANGSSPVVALGGNFYVGAGNVVDQTTLSGAGGFATAVNPFPTADPSAFDNVVTDGSELYAFNNIAKKAYAFDATRAQRYGMTLSNAVLGAPLLLTASAPTPGLLFNENNKSPNSSMYVLSLTTSTPTETGVTALAKSAASTATTAPTAPLLGSDNRVYTDGGGLIYAINQTNKLPFTTDWSYSVGTTATFNGPPTMDCNGVLYAASGGTVYAFVTDARGLANTPWPKYQRDSRNSGNADATTQWGVRTAPGVAGCTQ